MLLDVPRSLRPEEMPGWLGERIEELEPPVDLAGHSLGALVSVRVAALRPELVRRLVLIAPPGIRSRAAIEYAWPLVSSLVRSRPSFIARLTGDALRAGPRNLVRGGLHARVGGVEEELATVSAPTLLIWGESDRIVPPSDAPLWTDALSDARLMILTGARHVPMYEASDELAEAIAAFREERLDEAGGGSGM